MEITGKITHIMEARTGKSARTGSDWVVQEFVLETHDQYPRRCAFEVFGADRLREMNIQPNEELTVSFDIDAREFNGRWYNSIRAWKVERVPEGGVQPFAPAPPYSPAAPAAPAAAPVADIPAPVKEDEPDNLPF